jgi:tRNA-dihydrouridine synthase A
MSDSKNNLLSIAPMIDWSNTHFRVLMRLLSKHAKVYTEMVTPDAVTHNPRRSLCFDEIEHPLVLQLGGSCPNKLAIAAKKAQQHGFDEINLNLGCPSSKVQSGRFGACMMSEPDLSYECLLAMKDAVSIPVTAKTRIGIDDKDSYEFFYNYIKSLAAAGVSTFIIHARKAWLNGLSPKENRTIPPLIYDYVYRLKQENPDYTLIINGGILNIDHVKQHLKCVDGVMLGRLACQNPYAISRIESELFGSELLPRNQILKKYFEYCKQQFSNGVSLSLLIKPILNLAHGLSGAKLWRQKLSYCLQNYNCLDFADDIEQRLLEMESKIETYL